MLPLPDNPRSALLIIDMQNFFFRQPKRRHGLEEVIANINLLIDHFDACRMPVYHIPTCYREDGSDWDIKMKRAGIPELIEGSAEADFLPGIHIKPGHNRLVKTRYSAFFKTTLADELHDQKVDRVVVVGAYTHYCVNATIFDAYCHDFVPCLIIDAVISHLPDESAVMVERMRRNGYHIYSTKELIYDNH